MAGKDFTGRGRDVIDDLYHELDQLQKRVKFLENLKQPTVPKYDFTDPDNQPDDPIEGQVAVSGSDDDLHYFVNSLWRIPAATLPNLPWAQASEGTWSITSGTPSGSGAIFPGPPNFQTTDPSNFSFDGSAPTGVAVNDFGLYAVFMNIALQTVNLVDVSTNPDYGMRLLLGSVFSYAFTSIVRGFYAAGRTIFYISQIGLYIKPDGVETIGNGSIEYFIDTFPGEDLETLDNARVVVVRLGDGL